MSVHHDVGRGGTVFPVGGDVKLRHTISRGEKIVTYSYSLTNKL